MLRKKLFALISAATLFAFANVATAADHTDSPSASASPTADITDLYAWMSPDASRLELVLNVAGLDSATAFSDAVIYVFHVNSSSAYGQPQTETTITCKFYSATNIECWAGSAYVEGDPSNTDGITSMDDGLRVFAGLRDDPFFFELVGFNLTVDTVIAAAAGGGLTLDANNCPELDTATQMALVGQLQSSDAMGTAATDTFAGTNVLSLVVSIDKTLVNGGGDILGVWASTHNVQ